MRCRCCRASINNSVRTAKVQHAMPPPLGPRTASVFSVIGLLAGPAPKARSNYPNTFGLSSYHHRYCSPGSATVTSAALPPGGLLTPRKVDEARARTRRCRECLPTHSPSETHRTILAQSDL
ncbi:hypothetical protein RRG08_058700 [Elysia crispata]|uniref:Uncharacterized protein n=1 Tax=Elysia crispata TaxID=231223 RepID=A0AAE1D6D0_9GAST|nr:hypothetical protein RRG08_058700 [Elysia crispata]